MKYVLLVIVSMLIGCTNKKDGDKISSLPILDITKEYPIREMKLDDIADVEYVPLETTDESLLPSPCVFFDVSDKYIITNDYYGGNIYIFTRKGKFVRKINHLGQGAEEYICINQLVVDFKSEELYVGSYNNKKIFVYSFDGDFIREIPLETHKTDFRPIYNYNDEYLITTNKFFDFESQKCLDDSPYLFIHKMDGSMYPSKMKVPNRITSYLKAEILKLDEGTYYGHRASLPIQSIHQNGAEILIADFTLDTLYSLIGDELKPIAVQYPSVSSRNPSVVIAPNIYTDSFMSFRVISMYYDKGDEERPFNEAPHFVWNRRTNKIERWKVYNSLNQEIDILRESRSGRAGRTLPANTICKFNNASAIIEAYKMGSLTENAIKVTSGLHEEDNPVVVIVKFK